jgi:hypothetical protein
MVADTTDMGLAHHSNRVLVRCGEDQELSSRPSAFSRAKGGSIIRSSLRENPESSFSDDL